MLAWLGLTLLTSQVGALIGGVAGPVGSRRGGAGPLLPADNGEQRQN